MEEVKKVKCSNCDKPFSTKQALDYHLRQAVCVRKTEDYSSFISLVDLLKKQVEELFIKVSSLELENKNSKERINSLEEEVKELKKVKSPKKEEPKKEEPKKEEPKEEPTYKVVFNKIKNKYIEQNTGFVIDPATKIIIEKYNKVSGKCRKLCMLDIELLKQYKLKYDITTFSDYKNEEEEEEEEEEEVKDEIEIIKEQMKEEEERLNNYAGSKYFDKDENGKYHLGGISKKDIDFIKNKPKEDRKASKAYKELSKNDIKRMEEYFKYEPDMRKYNELQNKYMDLLYKDE